MHPFNNCLLSAKFEWLVLFHEGSTDLRPVYFFPHSQLYCDFHSGGNHTDSNSAAFVHRQKNISSYLLCTITLSRATAPPGYTVDISAPFTPHLLSSFPIPKLLPLTSLFLEIPMSFSKLPVI